MKVELNLKTISIVIAIVDILLGLIESTQSSLGDVLAYGVQFKTQKTVIENGAKEETVDGITLNKTANGIYSYYYGDDATHQNIIMTAKDPKVLAHAVKTMKYLENNTAGNDTNSSDDSGICPNCLNGKAQDGKYYY